MIRSILLVIALMSGGGALLLMTQGPATSATDTTQAAMLPEPSPEPEVAARPASDTTEVLSVRREVADGEALRPSDFAWIDWPTGFLMSGFIIREDEPDAVVELAGMIAGLDLAEGEPVLYDTFKAPEVVEDSTAFDAAVRGIGPGMRPVAVPVEVVRPLGAVLRRDDLVDLVHVYFPNDGDVPVSRILVPGARLLAIDPVAGDDATDLADDTQRNVVLALSVRAATEVLAATQVGSMSLLLRDPDDAENLDLSPPSYELARDIANGRRGFVLSGVDLASAGQVYPGDRVDILFTPGPEDDLWPSSRALVSNARVIGHMAAPAAIEAVQATSSDDRITLELDPAGVEAVTTALQRGVVSISLRPEGDVDAPYRVHPLPAPAVQVRIRRAGEL